jgi:hypothetical protein
VGGRRGVRGVAFIFALLFISGIFVMNVNNGRGVTFNNQLLLYHCQFGRTGN